VNREEDLRRIQRRIAETSRHALEVVRADTIEEAVTCLRHGRFDLVLLDLTTPCCRDSEFLEEVQAAAGDALIVILSNTPRSLGSQAAAADVGAQEVVTKDDPPRQTIRLLTELTAEHRKHRQTQQHLNHRIHDLELAEALQQRLYPDCAPDLSTFDIAGEVIPANHLCGDYYDFLPLDEKRILLVLGDVVGHGLPAALSMIELRSYLRALARQIADPGQLLSDLNRLLFEGGNPRLTTFFAAALHMSSGTLTYASAGHPGYMLNAAEDWDMLESTGLPLGVLPQSSIATAEPVLIARGDIVLLPTDGIHETLSPDGEMFGTGRLLDLARKHRHRSSQEIIDELCDQAREFAQLQPQCDDMTAVVVKGV